MIENLSKNTYTFAGILYIAQNSFIHERTALNEELLENRNCNIVTLLKSISIYFTQGRYCLAGHLRCVQNHVDYGK